MAVSGAASGPPDLRTVPALIAERAPRVLVVGDAILDTWLSGVAQRVSREAPVPVVDVTERRPLPGGAANTAANVAALGATTRLVGVVGDDSEGAELRRELDRSGVDTAELLIGADWATVTKQRVCSGDTVLARWDRCGPGRMSDRDASALAAAVERALPTADAVLLCDYGAGGVPDEVVEVLRRCRDRIGLLVVDAHRPTRWAPARPDVVTPNAAEAAGVLEQPLPAHRVDFVVRERTRLVERCGAASVVVTLDRDGAVLVPADPAVDVRHVSTVPAPESRACGAGDVFAASLTAALVCRVELSVALRLAQVATETAIAAATEEAGRVRIGTAGVGTPGVGTAGVGTVRVDPEALAARLAPRRPAPLSASELVDAVAEHRAESRRIVFTNGCFDVLHRGHVAYLEQARQLGDVLVVALNSDASVARLKGPDRPVNPAVDRASVLSALRCVDHVVVFEEDTPIGLLELVRPEVYAKGGDYTPQMLPETPVVRWLGGEVRVLDYLSEHSTTAIVRRIRDRAVS
ncbi:MAG TPA: D-glycero-beta-D-manno-heptose 1-phosphate adenylyltransferase [Pseudonocardia sp.]|uniref:D-glycero-beta-D-manno-heptose 1-phosphate adenylyltransferase n=1 Tax=Pseudonocardia sp. TaxID=60912 RepID=UPI002D06226E|nr:D-glycero-beta-D-manno-heptose 1-phosphate adenylyltransferase [Pseudonocardia sp.]HTF54769.1 D-glycero-beta-D-manno-heptose 1-phosphate adenylyltransferase [Pseudonocardia sp.]